MLLARIESLGHQTVSASDGYEDWNIITQPEMDIDIVVIDKEMPKMDGLEFVVRIKELKN
jgi:CheY-like chemotaxis protein